PVELATRPFHISLQTIVDQLGLTNADPVAPASSRFEVRIVACAGLGRDPAPADREILLALDMSIEELRSGRVSFAKRPNESRLHKRLEAILGFGGTSPTSGSGAGSWSQ